MIIPSFLAGKTVAVLGLGKSGQATHAALTAAGATVWAWDDGETARAAAQAAGIALTDLHAADFAPLAALVWSPGIPHTFPQPHPLAVKARARGLEPVCDIDLLARTKPAARLLAVTGTNGKSTTTTLLAHIEAAAGRPQAAGGNLGAAALSLPDLPPEGRYVLELSSYQLELSPSLALDAGVLLNITPDHLARHGGMDGYVAAKRRLFDLIRADGVAAVGVDDSLCAGLADALEAQGRKVVRISATRPLERGVCAPDGILTENGRAVVDLTRLPRLPGRHNWQNACAAFALARADGIAAEVAAAALATYPGLAHRQELVAVKDGIAYVNDSKATNADAAEKALLCYDSVYWIIGGQMKEGGIASLVPLFPRIRHAFLIGDATRDFARTLAGHVPATPCGTLDVAVARAHAMARAEKRPGAVVLLSPACASWDQFKSFEHRGEVFRALVAQLPDNQPRGGT